MSQLPTPTAICLLSLNQTLLAAAIVCFLVKEPEVAVRLGLSASLLFAASLMLCSSGFGQSDIAPLSAQTSTSVPLFIRTHGTVHDPGGQPLSGNTTITFTIYKDRSGREPVWQEAQNVTLDANGRYSALLGASGEEGLPLGVFATGEARWLGVRPDGLAEQPLIGLLSVPYALKAADADMLGGMPASSFLLANGQSIPSPSDAPGGSGTRPTNSVPSELQAQASCSAITSDGTATANQLSKFTGPCNIQNSAIFESGGKVGIGDTAPAGTLDVNGSAFIRGPLDIAQGAFFEPVETATSSKGYASTPLDLAASVYNTSVSAPADYLFRWQSTPVGNNTDNPGATLNLLYGVPGLVNLTGFSIANTGILTFAPGQTFPGAGSGTVTNIATGAGLTGGPITKSGTIGIPNAGVTNAMLANPSVTIDAGSGLAGGGTVALGGAITLTNSAPSSGGTVTNINTGSGLTGGPITKSGTISIPNAGVINAMLENPSVTVQAGLGLSGGGKVALGGTVTLNGNISGATNGIGIFSAPSVITSTAAPKDGQILIGSTGNAPVLGNLAAGKNVTITNEPGSITISAAAPTAPNLPFFVTGNARTGSAQAPTQNVTALWGFLLPYFVTTSRISYDVTQADNTANDYDLGIYTNVGKLVLDLGAVPGTSFAPAIGFKTLTWKQGSLALGPGRYYLGFTTNCSTGCARIAAAGGNVSFATNAPGDASTGGVLPAATKPPADNWTTGIQPTAVIH